MWPAKLLSTTCCISNQRFFDDRTASGGCDASLSVVVVVLVVLCNQLHIYWCSIWRNQSGYSLRRHLDFGYVLSNIRYGFEAERSEVQYIFWTRHSRLLLWNIYCLFWYLSSVNFLCPGKLLSTTCCISNRRLFDNGTASEDCDICLSVVVAVVLGVLCTQLYIYWCSIWHTQSGYPLRRHLDFC